MGECVVSVKHVSHRYGPVLALDDVSFEVQGGCLFGFLGSNGSGKSTLLAILSSLLAVQSGVVRVLGIDVSRGAVEYRRMIGVAFQNPALDRRLTVRENLVCHGNLYGLVGGELVCRVHELLERFGLSDRADDLVGVLSGGLSRRVELAKCLVHRPRLLLMDEPSSGLDPVSRREFWGYVNQLRLEEQVTVVVSTHLMDEAERCDRLIVLDSGRVIVNESVDALKCMVGRDSITIVADRLDEFKVRIRDDMGVESQRCGDVLRVHCVDGGKVMGEIASRYRDQIRSISLGAPTLDDVYFAISER